MVHPVLYIMVELARWLLSMTPIRTIRLLVKMRLWNTPEQLAKLRELSNPMSGSEAMGVIKSGSGIKAPAKPLTPSQRTYRMARPFVAPVVETAGMVGGALLGAGTSIPVAGTTAIPGAIAGAGLGYGMGKQVMKAGDYNLGGYEPPAFNEQLLDAGKDVAEGAAFEVAGPHINKAVGFTLGGLKDAGVMAKNALGGATKQLAERRAAKIAQQAASSSPVANLQDTRSAISQRGAGQTGAQATANLQNPTLQALLERGGARNPGLTLQIENQQAKESANALRSLAPWENQTQGQQATDLLQEVLNKRTTPLREAAIQGANATGDLKGLPVYLQAQGPLNNPANAGNDLIEGSVKNFMDEVAKWTNANSGVIDATALDAIRKNSVNATIAKLRPGVDANTQRKMAAGVLGDIKPVIDNAIEQTGGKGWTNYLAEHSAGMKDIAGTKLTGEALRLWETDKKGFVDLVRGNSKETVEQILGPGQYDIAKALTQREMGVLQSEAGKITTNEQVKSQSAKGQESLAELMKRNIPSYKFPFLLNWKVSAANQLVGRAEKGLSRNVLDQLSEASTDPEKLKQLLERIPPSYRSTFLNALKSNKNMGVNNIPGAVFANSASGVEDDGRQ